MRSPSRRLFAFAIALVALGGVALALRFVSAPAQAQTLTTGPAAPTCACRDLTGVNGFRSSVCYCQAVGMNCMAVFGGAANTANSDAVGLQCK